MLLFLLYIKKIFDEIVLFDKNPSSAEGKALDLTHASFIAQTDVKVIGTSNYSSIKNSDVIIITAGKKRSPNMSREDLLRSNIKVMKQVAVNILNTLLIHL